MAQLSDDCFAFGGSMMTVEETLDLLAARLPPIGAVESVSLARADGRILAEDVVAPMALPPYANSAVDGYAVRGSDLPETGSHSLLVAGRVQAGAAAASSLPARQAVRIFTGGPMPEGFDTVFMQEDVQVEGSGAVVLPAGLKAGANMRPAGEDVRAGDTVLAAGHRLRPQDVAMAAALARTELNVSRAVRVAVFSTGDEIVEPGAPRHATQLFDSNRFMLMAMLGRLGCDVTDLGIVPDDLAVMTRAIEAASAQSDLILTSGGVSTGDADFVKEAVASTGSLVFWRIAIKPGRPVAMGVVRGTPFIGLPGNPVASFVTFAQIARPAILALAGCKPTPIAATPIRADFSYRKKLGRREYVRASLRPSSDGSLVAGKFPREGAGLLSSLIGTDGLVELREEVSKVERGEMVDFIPYAALY